MATHKALVLSSFTEPIRVETVSTPTVERGSAIIRVLYTGLQHYSRAIFTGKLPYPLTLPQTPGHSGIGRIEAVGADATRLKPSQLVWTDSTIAARDDPDTQILLGLFAGFTEAHQKLMREGWREGTYAQVVKMPLENVFPLNEERLFGPAPKGLSYKIEDLATLSTFLVPFGGLDWAGVGPGTTVIAAPATGKFSGGGVLVALGLGAKVIAVSRNVEVLEKLKILPGAEERLTIVQSVSDVEKDKAAILQATGGKGAHAYLDLSPAAAFANGTPAYLTASLSALKKNGIAVFMGGIFGNVELSYLHLAMNNLVVRGQFMYERSQVEKFLRLVENGNIRLDEKVGLHVNGVFGLDDIEEALNFGEQYTAWGQAVLLAPNGKNAS